jgi:D-glycero-alpha-D-manno-heptose-7-phosphate kinase
MQFERGIELHHDGDLPARSGMGSSSSFTVGMLNAVRALNGQISSKSLLATESIHIEQNVMHETVGCQDQLAAAYGGLNKFEFSRDGSHTVHPLTLRQERIDELHAHLMLMYTGIRRTASEVANSYVGDITTKTRQLHSMRGMVEDAILILDGSEDIRRFGQMLHESWLMKRSLGSMVSNSEVDDIYNAARSRGAIGGKLLGAGGGGFMLIFAPPETQSAIRSTLNDLIHVPFKFERSGSQVIFYEQQADYGSVEREGPSYARRSFYEMGDGRRA